MLFQEAFQGAVQMPWRVQPFLAANVRALKQLMQDTMHIALVIRCFTHGTACGPLSHEHVSSVVFVPIAHLPNAPSRVNVIHLYFWRISSVLTLQHNSFTSYEKALQVCSCLLSSVLVVSDGTET